MQYAKFNGMKGRSKFLNLLAVCAILLTRWSTQAAVITISPGDSYTKIESAKAGDEVVISPGTYAFRVYLTGQGTAANPIVIRAQDPANPPVWDFGTTLVENAPGSYTAGDRGRGGWQFSGAKNYRVSGLVLKHCRTASFNSAGVRYYNGSTNIYLKDCVFFQNDDGLTGGTQNSQITIENCEFDSNGNTNASSSSPTHNLYIYGGYFTMRYCYVHDSAQSQNFHIRARSSTIEYNWFARAKAYEGDLMTDDDFSGTGPFSQSMTLRGNVFVQHPSPANHSQVIAMYNDGALPNLTLSARAIHNTLIGNGGFAAFVHMSNADGTQMTLEESNNIIFGTTQPVLIETTAAASVTGRNNWLQTNAAIGTLSASVQSSSPGFKNRAANDFTLAPGSACVGMASGTVYGLPGREYFKDEVTNRLWRVRATARDIGAFESTTISNPVGPYDPIPLPRVSIAGASSSRTVEWPLFADDFQLQTTTSLSVASWMPATLPLSTNVTGIQAMIPLGVNQIFLRLQK